MSTRRSLVEATWGTIIARPHSRHVGAPAGHGRAPFHWSTELIEYARGVSVRASRTDLLVGSRFFVPNNGRKPETRE